MLCLEYRTLWAHSPTKMMKFRVLKLKGSFLTVLERKESNDKGSRLCYHLLLILRQKRGFEPVTSMVKASNETVCYWIKILFNDIVGWRFCQVKRAFWVLYISFKLLSRVFKWSVRLQEDEYCRVAGERKAEEGYWWEEFWLFFGRMIWIKLK